MASKAQVTQSLTITLVFDTPAAEVLLKGIPILLKNSRKLTDSEKGELTSLYNSIYGALFPINDNEDIEGDEDFDEDEEEEDDMNEHVHDLHNDDVGAEIPQTWNEIVDMDDEELLEMAESLGLPPVSKRQLAGYLGINTPKVSSKVKKKKTVAKKQPRRKSVANSSSAFVDPRTKLRNETGKIQTGPAEDLFQDWTDEAPQRK